MSFNTVTNSQTGQQNPVSAKFNESSVEATISNQRLQLNTAFQAFVGTVGNQSNANGVRLNFDNGGKQTSLNGNGFSIQSGDLMSVGNGKDLRSLAARNDQGQSVAQNLLRVRSTGTNDSSVSSVPESSGTDNSNTGSTQRPTDDNPRGGLTRTGNSRQDASQILQRSGVDLSTSTGSGTTTEGPQGNRVSDLWSSAGRSWKQAGRNIGIGGPEGNSMRDTSDRLQRAAVGRLQSNARNAIDSVVAGRSMQGLSKTEADTLEQDITAKLTELGFNEGEIQNILGRSERTNSQGRGTGVFDLSIREGQIRKALEGSVDIGQNRVNGNIAFNATLNSGAQRFAALNNGSGNLGSTNINTSGEITGDGNLGREFAQALNQDRADIAGRAIASQLRTQLGVSDISIFAQGNGTVQLGADGSVTGMKVGSRMVSTEQFARELLQSKQREPVTDQQVQNLVRSINDTAQRAVQGATNDIGRGGSRGGMSATAQATLDNLNASMRAAGVDPSKTNITFDGKGGANVSFENGESFNISKDGTLTTPNPSGGEGTPLSGEAAARAFVEASGASPEQAEGIVSTFNRNQDQINNLRKMIDSSMKNQGDGSVKSGIDRVLGGIGSLGLTELLRATTGNARTQNLNVSFDDSGNITGANVVLNNGNSFNMSINQQRGNFAIDNFRNGDGRRIDDPTNGGSARLLEQLRRGGLNNRDRKSVV